MDARGTKPSMQLYTNLIIWCLGYVPIIILSNNMSSKVLEKIEKRDDIQNLIN